jgi:hypothetical protein
MSQWVGRSAGQESGASQRPYAPLVRNRKLALRSAESAYKSAADDGRLGAHRSGEHLRKECRNGAIASQRQGLCRPALETAAAALEVGDLAAVYRIRQFP